jgi:hypothetical protein
VNFRAGRDTVDYSNMVHQSNQIRTYNTGYSIGWVSCSTQSLSNKRKDERFGVLEGGIVRVGIYSTCIGAFGSFIPDRGREGGGGDYSLPLPRHVATTLL